MSGLEKLDTGLLTALRAYESEREAHPADGISVSLRFTGDLAAIEALRFETHMVSGDEALGVVRFKDIAALVAHPGVIRIAAGRPKKTDLDTAVKDIRARASAPISGAPGDGLWYADVASGALTNVADATGKDVIVAIIDTGIDYTHPMFMSQLTPTKTTRILRIWDQGLTPVLAAECPHAEFLASGLASGDTYGVEYTDDQIDAALNGGAAIWHMDCEGHGTHVAGIAAGGVVFPNPSDASMRGDASKVGVAPEASIIVVKHLDNPDKIYYYPKPGAARTEVSSCLLFRDAVLYCLRTARDLGKPVVINMSFGDPSLPGDGLDDEERFVDRLMDPTQAAGLHNFPTGAIVVKSAGNTGKAADRQVARIEVPDSGEIIVPFSLFDARDGYATQWKQCDLRPHKPDVGVHFWYRQMPAPVQFAMCLPGTTEFDTDVAVGDDVHEIGFKHIVGPPLHDIVVPPSSSVHRAGIKHEDPGPVPHPDGESVHRLHAHFFVKPKESGLTISYHPGIYQIRIKAPAATVVYAMCEEEYFFKDGVVWFSVPKVGEFHLDTAHIHVTSESSAFNTYGRHVITVAAYDDTDGKTAAANHYKIAATSSRGPLRDFSDPANPLAVINKPDIAAPGVKINSAAGKDTPPPPVPTRLGRWRSGIRFIEMDGTSMAAPMIAGVIALMLDKKGDLNTTQVRTFLAEGGVTRPGVDPAAPPDTYDFAYGSGMVNALTSHKNTH